MYTLLLVTVLAGWLAYLKALADGQKRWWALFVLATTLSFYLHILAPLTLLVYLAIALIYFERTRRFWPRWLASMACLTLPYAPLVIWQFSYLASGQERGHPFYPLAEQLTLQLRLYSHGLLQLTGYTAVTIFLFLLLCGLFLPPARPHRWKPRLVLATWLALPTLAIHLISLRVPVFEDRYLIYITPAFYLLAVGGLLQLRRRRRELAALCLGLLLTINLMSLWQQQQRVIKADFRAAAAYLLEQPQPPNSIMIQIPYLQRTFEYYYPQPYQFIDGLWTNDGKSEQQLHQEMQTITAAHPELWLVVSEEPLWDRRQLVRQWLEENAALLDHARFNRVDVYRYQLHPDQATASSLSGP